MRRQTAVAPCRPAYTDMQRIAAFARTRFHSDVQASDDAQTVHRRSGVCVLPIRRRAHARVQALL
eukprot:2060906-Alexandrium_andersonii.AAC.1